MNHTLGPWEVVYGSSGYPRAVIAPRDKGIPGAVGNVVRWNGIGLPSSPIAKANALLIAAAPDLLEVAKLVVRYWDIHDPNRGILIEEAVMRARHAIAKTEGQNSCGNDPVHP